MTHPYVVTARGLIDRPFRHRGRGPLYFDCVGVLVWIVKQNGAPVHDQTTYQRTPHGGQLRAALEQHCGQPIPKSEMQPGDFLLLREKKRPMHVALVADYLHGGLSMIHADAREGKVVECRLSDDWRAKIVGVYRHGA